MTPFQIVLLVGTIMFMLGVVFAEEARSPFAMKVGQDWKILLRHAWSVRLIFVAALLSGLEAVLPIIGYKLPVNDIALAAINFIIVVGALVARFIVQDKIDT